MTKIFDPARMARKPDAVLFDTDNTLYPYDPANAAAVAAVVAKATQMFAIGADQVQAALVAREKVAVMSANEELILQAGKDLHLNPFEAAGAMDRAEALSPGGSEPRPVCDICGTELVGGTCPNASDGDEHDDDEEYEDHYGADDDVAEDEPGLPGDGKTWKEQLIASGVKRRPPFLFQGARVTGGPQPGTLDPPSKPPPRVLVFDGPIAWGDLADPGEPGAGNGDTTFSPGLRAAAWALGGILLGGGAYALARHAGKGWR